VLRKSGSRILRAERGLLLRYLARPRIHSDFSKNASGTRADSRLLLPILTEDWRAQDEGIETSLAFKVCRSKSESVALGTNARAVVSNNP
jgi:hypothetical protein